MNLRFVLASNSPRRKQLMSLTGLSYEVVPAEVDETPHMSEFPGDYVLRLAKEKARAAAEQIHSQAFVLAADTTVVEGTHILGKPGSPAEAVWMLERLRGHTHQVYTGVALLRLPDWNLWTDLGVTDVPMRDYNDAEIQAYVKSGDPLDKAGAYAIQHPGFHPVADLQGCFANVVGLPLCHLARTLKKAGMTGELGVGTTPLPQACQSYLDYRCPVYYKILRGDI